jgi:hypothetical protein
VPLRDGDEIGVGRTMLRFSREMPSYASEVKADSEGRTSYAGRRSSQVQTTFMGVVEQRDQLHRQQSKRLGKMVAIVLSAAVVISALASAIYGRKSGGPAAAGVGPQTLRTNAAGAVARPVADSAAGQPGAAAAPARDSVSSAGATSLPR